MTKSKWKLIESRKFVGPFNTPGGIDAIIEHSSGKRYYICTGYDEYSKRNCWEDGYCYFLKRGGVCSDYEEANPLPGRGVRSDVIWRDDHDNLCDCSNLIEVALYLGLELSVNTS